MCSPYSNTLFLGDSNLIRMNLEPALSMEPPLYGAVSTMFWNMNSTMYATVEAAKGLRINQIVPRYEGLLRGQ